ncbi:hypothetical protein Tco_0981125 [Tanacetum coccineum]
MSPLNIFGCAAMAFLRRSVVDYDDEYQGELQKDSQKDKLTTVMMLLARAISQKFSTPTNNHLRILSNTRNQALVQDDRVDLQTKNAGYGGNANKNAGRQNRNQAFNAGNGNDESNQIVQRVPRTESTPGKANVQSMKEESGSNLNNKENDFMLDTSYGEETMEELTAIVMLMARIQPANGNTKNVPSYDAKAVSEVNASSMVHEQYKETCEELEHELRNDKDTIERILKEKDKIQNDFLKVENEKIIIQHETQLEKKAFKEREDRYLDDILDLEEKLSSHDRIVYKMGQSIQTIHMLGKKPNKVYDPFLKAGLGYTNPVRLKKAIAAQPKMYDGDLIHNNKLVIHSTDSEETLEDAKESRNKMRHKMVQIDYEKLNALYETFVPQQELSAEQTYFSIPSTSDNGSKSKDVPSESPERRWLSDSQNELREFYKTDVILMSRSIKEELIEEVQEMLNIFVTMEQKVNEKSPTEILLQNEIDRLLEVSLTSEIRDCVLLSVEQQKHELLKVELEKSSSDSRDIQANLLKRIKILENDFQRSQAQSIAFELKLQHQKEKMACDVSWKAKLSTLHDENVLLKHQVESTVKERENIKLEFQRLFNSVKATRAQHQNEINEMIENVNQKTYDYADVRAQNQDLLMTISELKSKLRMIDKGKNVNTKFDKSETLGQLLCVTPFNKNLAIKAKNVSNTKVTSDRPNPVTSQSTPTIEKKQQHNANVIARGMYKINQQDTNTPNSKANTNVSNSTGVGSSNSVRRPKSKDNKSKNSVLKNTKSSSTYVWKTTNSVCLDSNKCETKPSNVCQTNACITNSKTVTAVNDGLNILCISCGLDVFLHSHDKCVARHALTRKSSVKRALFTSPVAAKSKGLGATSVVAKSRFSVAKTPTATNKVSSVSPLSQKSSQSRILRANERPPMLEKGNYIPWESRFKRFLDNKLEDRERMWNSIQNGPYQRPMIVDPTNPTVPILEPLSKMTEGNKKQYIADVRVMNYLLLAIPNDIYIIQWKQCKIAKEMWATNSKG